MKHICEKCGKTFLSKDSKSKFCSRECYMDSRFENRHKKNICLYCGNEFKTKSRDRKYCSIGCYTLSGEFNERLKAYNDSRKNKETVQCLYCGKNLEKHPSSIKKSQNKRFFCDRYCYRKYKSEKYDLQIANPIEVNEMQNFDEFLSGEFLECPICHWTGKSLSQHISQEHGLYIKDFKKKAGFNQGTGLVSEDVSRKFSETIKKTINEGKIKPLPRGHNYGGKLKTIGKTKEGEEHRIKTYTDLKTTEIKIICAFCGKEFTSNGFIKKYCSSSCLYKNYRKNKKMKPECI